MSVLLRADTYVKLEELGQQKGSSPVPVAFRSQPLFCLVEKLVLKSVYKSGEWPFPIPTAELPRGEEPRCTIPSSI